MKTQLRTLIHNCRFEFKIASHRMIGTQNSEPGNLISGTVLKILATVAVGIFALGTTPVHAGGSWLSQVHHTPAQSGTTLTRAESRVASTLSEFDIVISLEADPQGDDDANNDPGASDDEQNVFERAIRKFADGVCQQTNKAHKLKVVHIFRNYKENSRADIDWKTNCPLNKGPRASVNGFGVPGDRIYMCENWPGGLDPTDQNWPKDAGYTLAHEWGHYAYGLYDEYVGNQGNFLSNFLNFLDPWQPRDTDTASSPSVMHTQWCAVQSSSCPSGTINPADFLEFSTDQVAPFDGSGGENAQSRMYGRSGWDTLVNDPKNDARWKGLWLTNKRTRYTNLAGVKPPKNGDFTVNDAESGCQSSLDIVWESGNLTLDILIDRSGSMDGAKITGAKAAANLLIDQLKAGSSAVGVSSFADDVTNDYAITSIPDPDTGVKAAAKSAVGSITASGFTSLFDGLDLSHGKLVNSYAQSRRTVYVLSDGQDNDSAMTEVDIIAAYNASGIPIIAFGYGAGAPGTTLTRLAAGTGGQFFHAPATQAAIKQAFLAATSAVSDQVVAASQSIPVSTSSTAQYHAVTVDDTLEEILILLTYSGTTSDIDFALLRPGQPGSDTGVTFECESAGGETSCTTTLDRAGITAGGTGDYSLQITNNTGEEIDVGIIVTAVPRSGDTYNVAVSIGDGESEEVAYPAPVVIRASVRKDTAIAGLVVSADVSNSSGTLVDTVDLLDDGNDADAIMDDGIYTGVFSYSGNGIYSVVVKVDNSAGTGRTTIRGELTSLAADGTAQDPAAAEDPITASFSRASFATVTVTGVGRDDHPDDPTSGCTAISDDNTDVEGRIDHAGDVDCFSFTPSDVSSTLVVRSTAQIDGMDSVLTVLASDATTEIAKADSSGSANPLSGVFVTIPASSIDPSRMSVTVAHSDPAADRGNYAVSAGPALVSDQVPTPAPAKPTGARATGGNASVMLAWADPSDATITRWQYRHKAGSGAYGSWTDVPGSDAGTTSYTVTGLTNGTAYTFQIRAVNATGGGAASDEVSATPAAPVAPPPPPPPPQPKKSGAIDLWTLGIGVLFGLAGLFGRRRRS